jgi:Kef-type K+ transport system membrane component KefB
MTTTFAIAVVIALVLPVLVSRLLHVERLFPPVFVQLMCGLLLNLAFVAMPFEDLDLAKLSGLTSESLSGLGWLGVSLLVALAGGKSAEEGERIKPWQFVPISVVGFGVTCLLGTFVGQYLAAEYPDVRGSKADVATFSLAIGLSLSVTALPVLLAMLRTTGLANTPLGNLATRCALLDDVWLWGVLAIVLSWSTEQQTEPIAILVMLGAYVCVMFALVKPGLARLFSERPDMASSDRMLISLFVIFSSEIVTNAIGVHAMIGAFVAGVVLPREAVESWRDSVLHFAQMLLLPFFFVATGMSLKVNTLAPSFWSITVIVILAAFIGKFASVTLTSRALGSSWLFSMQLGCMLQCKGLMELVAINVLLSAGIIGESMFSALAMMAVFSTFITAPAIGLLNRQLGARSMGKWDAASRAAAISGRLHD